MKQTYRNLHRYLGPILQFFFPVAIHGKENIPEGAAMVCANHSSLLDPLLVALAFGKQQHLHFMAKKELFGIPVIGKIIANAEAFPVDRSSNDLGAIRTAMRYLKTACKVMLFPEGTRVSEDDAVAAKSGAIRLASRAKVPIVPVYVPRKKRMFRKTPIVIGKPYYIEQAGRDEFEALSGQLMDKIYELKAES